ncbi:hypothetical protein GP486_007558 [Trichoglossum hirsutum]|uniref:Cytochrome P450 n=1 Tax=Trichoglossum hirsutum TaxID=265104 RepID=A0A9P8II22_9PEZI|nr:hypothetical protein GP486_007558 [Trichoglossum hirsutum]
MPVSWLTFLLSATVTVLVACWKFMTPPRLFPKNIPTIPFYVAFLNLLFDMSQDEIYDRYFKVPLRRYGAVKVWASGNWSVLVQKPELLMEMFKDEDLYVKAGLNKRIPWTVLGHLVGDNIINAHGETWRSYTGIMKLGIHRRVLDVGLLHRINSRTVELLLDEQRRSPRECVLVNPFLQRWAIACLGQSFLDIDFKVKRPYVFYIRAVTLIWCIAQTLENPNTRINQLQTTIKRTIFKAPYFHFPILDYLPIPSRVRAFRIVQEFEELLFDLTRGRPKSKRSTEDHQLIDLMERALKEGKWSERNFRDNLKIIFIAGHENPQQIMNSALWALGKHQDVQCRLRAEVLGSGIDYPMLDAVNDLPYLTAVCYEVLRLYPPLSQLINRQVKIGQDACLGGSICIPGGTYVGWTAVGTQRDPETWGPTAAEFIPSRWGTQLDEIQATYRRRSSKGHFIAFNAGRRKCLGKEFALVEMKLLLFELVRSVEWDVDPRYSLKLTPVGNLNPGEAFSALTTYSV